MKALKFINNVLKVPPNTFIRSKGNLFPINKKDVGKIDLANIDIIEKKVKKHPMYRSYEEVENDPEKMRIKVLSETSLDGDDKHKLLKKIPMENPDYAVVGQGYEIIIDLRDPSHQKRVLDYHNSCEISPSNNGQKVPIDKIEDINFQALDRIEMLPGMNVSGAMLVHHRKLSYISDDKKVEKEVIDGQIALNMFNTNQIVNDIKITVFKKIKI